MSLRKQAAENSFGREPGETHPNDEVSPKRGDRNSR